MLYGIRRDVQHELRKAGYNVRVYVPFGEAWYPYLMRRMAERPANLFFVASAIIAESPLRFLLRGNRKANGTRETE
jgi:proline dehydrogenase